MNRNIVELKHLEEKLNSGKQLGTRYSFKLDDEIFWSSVGIQKWDGLFKVYFDKVSESKMAMDAYQTEISGNFENLIDAINFIELNTKVNFIELKPCKGQKVFNPAFL